MVSTEVQRTLVKSPPELWTELSDATALARHLEGLGEVTITALEPETRIAWRAANANGTVVLKPSGWGTKVKLTVVRDVPAGQDGEAPAAEEPHDEAGQDGEEQAQDEAQDEPQGPAAADEPAPGAPEEPPPPPLTAAARFAPHHPSPLLPGAIVTEDPLEADTTPQEMAEPEAEAEPDPPEAAEPEDLEPLAFGTPRRERRGFFARLFARRRARAAEEQERESPFPVPRLEPLLTAQPGPAEAYDEAGAEPDAEPLEAQPAPAEDSVQRLEAALDSLRAPERAPEASQDPPADAPQAAEHAAAAETPATDAEDAPDLAAELREAEEAVAAETEAVLTSMLDRLGSAHHRPFSRA